MKTIKLIFLFLLFATFLGCNKGSMWNKEEGVLRNATGLDGCGWVIESGSGTYEPLNLHDFDMTLEDGKKVKFSFKDPDEPMGSFCQVGEIIRIKKIKAVD